MFAYSYSKNPIPDFFRNKNTKDEFQVQFEILKVFSSVSIQKEVFIKEFLNSYPSVLSNQRRTKIKKLFIQLVGRLKENDLIESNYKIILKEFKLKEFKYNGFLLDTDVLTISNISEGFVIYEKLSI